MFSSVEGGGNQGIYFVGQGRSDTGDFAQIVALLLLARVPLH